LEVAAQRLQLLFGDQADAVVGGHRRTSGQGVGCGKVALLKCRDDHFEVAPAKQIPRRYIDAVVTGDIESARWKMDLPFVVASSQERFTTSEQIVELLTKAADNVKTEWGTDYTWTVRGQMQSGQLAARDADDLLNGIDGIPVSQLSWVFVQFTIGKESQYLYLIVRTTGVKTSIIGMGEGSLPKKL
jgi:hypothetical protein